MQSSCTAVVALITYAPSMRCSTSARALSRALPDSKSLNAKNCCSPEDRSRRRISDKSPVGVAGLGLSHGWPVAQFLSPYACSGCVNQSIQVAILQAIPHHTFSQRSLPCRLLNISMGYLKWDLPVPFLHTEAGMSICDVQSALESHL
jgi:hypothetical protein